MGIQLGNLFIPYYGLLIITGVIIAAIIGCIQVHTYKLDINDFIVLASFVALGGIIGAKILYIIVSVKQIDWSRIFEYKYFLSIMSGGFVFYGGLIGGLLSLILYQKLMHVKVLDYVNVCMPCIPVVHAFGRLGCALVGCCYGAPYNGICCIVYHNSNIAPNNIPLFPVQATEAIFNLIIATILLIYIRKCKKLFTLPLYLILYAPLRFILEFLRYDNEERGFISIFSTSQWISIALIVLAVIIIKFQNKSYNSDT